MVFIKKVKSGSNTYHYLVYSYRSGKSVHQKTIRRLTPEEVSDPAFIDNFLKEHPRYQKKLIKAIIPAAGKSLRLSPYAQDIPKGLIKIKGKPILQYVLDSLYLNKVSDVVLVTGFKDRKMREMFEGEVKIIYNPFYPVSGLLASVWTAIHEISGPLLILYSDIIFDQSIVHKLLQDEHDISVAVTPSVIDHESEKAFVENGILREIGDNIPDSQVNYEFAGIVKFSKKGAEYLRETLEEISREESFLDLFFTSIIERLIYKGYEISTQVISNDLWVDIDFPKDLRRAKEVILPNIEKLELKS